MLESPLLEKQNIGFDSNRISGGFGYVFNKHLAMEGSWMTQLGANKNNQHFLCLSYGIISGGWNEE